MLVFNKAKLPSSGDDWEGRWVSECKTYTIMRFKYRSTRGEPARPVPTYYRAYKNSSTLLEGGSLEDVIGRIRTEEVNPC